MDYVLVAMTIIIVVLIFLLCQKHVCKKFGKIQEEGCQYCGVCGKAFFPKHYCQHIWKIIETNDISMVSKMDYNNKYPIGKMYVLQCSLCGELKNHETNSD